VSKQLSKAQNSNDMRICPPQLVKIISCRRLFLRLDRQLQCSVVKLADTISRSYFIDDELRPDTDFSPSLHSFMSILDGYLVS
jgi:hypothetical protein